MKPLLFFHIFLFLFIFTNAQFGEIASIVGSVLGGGAGLGSAAGAAATAGSGAAGALGNIGQLYQLAQTALSLTGTGVGILNQASESSWFPAAVEQAVKNNRDFQEKLLATNGGGGGAGAGGLGGLSGLSGLAGMGSSSSKIGKEYGKNFETEDGSEEAETKSPSLEKELKELEKEEKLTEKYLGKASIEEVDEFGRPVEKTAEGGLTGPIPTPAALSSGPKITVEIPQKVKKADVKDYEELLGKQWPGDDQDREAEFSTDEEEVSKMVPELQKLIHDLKKSNLSRTEYQEIVKQLESNHEDNIGQPRENTTPISPPKSSELGSEEQEQPPPEPKIKKYGKNIPAFRRILGTSIDSPVTVTATPKTRTTTKPSHIQNRSGFIPAFSTTKLPQSTAVKNGFMHRVDSEAANTKILIAPRAVPTVVAPRPVAKGVIQQRFYPNQQKPNPYHTAQTHAAVPQQPQQTYPVATQPQQQNYVASQTQQNQQQAYANYQQQYQEYLRKYYPAYALPYTQQQYQTFYQQPAQAHGQRIYPLAHPYGQGVLLTNQQPYQQNIFGKK